MAPKTNSPSAALNGIKVKKLSGCSTSHSSELEYRPDIDGLRAVAVLAILLFHAFPEMLPAGFIGVDIFFVISGYLIGGIICSKLKQDTFSFLDFYSRRVRRIFPALFTVLLFFGFAGWYLLLADEYRALAKHSTAAALFIANFAFWSEAGYFDQAAETKPLLHLWSLGIEEQFYIVFPLLLWSAWRLRLSLRRAVILLGSLSFAANLLIAGTDPIADFFAPWNRAWELMVGAALAFSPAGARSPALRSALSGLGIALLGLSFMLTTRASSFPGALAALPVAGAALIIFSGSGTVLNRLLASRALVWIGLISYPLYLWHWPLLTFTRILSPEAPPASCIVGVVALSFLLAWLTERYVERPWRADGRAAQKILTLILFMVSIAVAGTLISRNDGYPERLVFKELDQLTSANNLSLRSLPPSCPDSDSLPQVLRSGCILHVNAGAAPRVVVWGDSHAEFWRHPFAELAKERGFELYIFSLPGCPPLKGVRRTDFTSTTAHCSTLEASDLVLGDVLRLEPAALFVVGRWDLYSNGWVRGGRLYHPTHFLTSDPSGEATRESSRAALAAAIPATLSAIQDSGTPFAVIFPPPLLRDSVTNRRKDLNELEPLVSEHAEGAAAYRSSFGSVPTLDTAKRLCGEKCAASLDGELLYIDDNHLQHRGAMLFKGDLQQLLDQLTAR